MITLFYDGLIALAVAAAPLYLIWMRRRGRRLSTRGRSIALVAVLSAVWVVVVYGSFIEPKLITVRTHPVRLGASGPQLRVAVVSDLHLGIYKHREWTARVVSRINSLEPDLVILAGDLATVPAGLDGFGPLKDLKSRFGAYAVLGNWDYRAGAVDVRRRVESYNVEVLTNESVPIEVGGKTVRLIGLDDYRYGRPDWRAALAGVPEEAVKILAVHNPDFAPEAELRGIDLAIAGHTHAGQIRLPFIGPVPPLPTKLGRNYDRGVFEYGPMRLFITSGAGESGPRARLFNPPEISLLNIQL